MEITVKILQVLPEQRGTSARGEWVKSGFVGETFGDYPKQIAFEVVGADRCAKVMPYIVVGAVLKIGFDVSSREYNGKWYSSITCFSAYGGQQGGAQPEVQQQVGAVPSNAGGQQVGQMPPQAQPQDYQQPPFYPQRQQQQPVPQGQQPQSHSDLPF